LQANQGARFTHIRQKFRVAHRIHHVQLNFGFFSQFQLIPLSPPTQHYWAIFRANDSMWPFTSGGSTSSSNGDGPSSSSSSQSAAAPSTIVQDSPTTYFASESSRFDQSRPTFDPSQAPSTQDLFSNAAFDASRLHPLAGLRKDEIEYLDIVDAQPSTLEGARTALPSRGWSDDLCYGTGTTYLSGKSYPLHIGSYP
jgi:hypothetical protein